MPTVKRKDWRHFPTSNQQAQHEITERYMRRNGIDTLPAADTARLVAPKNKNLLSPHQFELATLITLPDDRQPVNASEFPYRSICLLEITDQQGAKYSGSGFFISKKCVITAGHCVFFHGSWAKSITVIPGANGASAPFGKTMSLQFQSVTGWTMEGSQNFDYGAVILEDESLFKLVDSCMSYTEDTNDNNILLSGYPSDKSKTQWKSQGSVLSRSKFRMYYDLDTVEGHSGSPIFSTDGIRNQVIGVHTQGNRPNYGVRISAGIMERWQQWSAL